MVVEQHNNEIQNDGIKEAKAPQMKFMIGVGSILFAASAIIGGTFLFTSPVKTETLTAASNGTSTGLAPGTISENPEGSVPTEAAVANSTESLFTSSSGSTDDELLLGAETTGDYTPTPMPTIAGETTGTSLAPDPSAGTTSRMTTETPVSNSYDDRERTSPATEYTPSAPNPVADTNSTIVSFEETPQRMAQKLYWIQVGSYSSNDNALAIKDEFEGKGVSPSIHSRVINGKVHYRVRLGTFDSPGEAERFAKQVRMIEGFENSYVVETLM